MALGILRACYVSWLLPGVVTQTQGSWVPTLSMVTAERGLGLVE
jgi:hypothetical protein